MSTTGHKKRRKLRREIKNLRCPSGEVELDTKLMSPLDLTSFLIGELYFQQIGRAHV